MKLIKTVDAEGAVLCHDITQIIKGVTKDAVFRKGHIVTKEDIPVLLSVGKDTLYVWEKQEGILHEDDAAEILCEMCEGEHMKRSGTKEGKIELLAECDGLLKVSDAGMRAVNGFGQMMIASRNGNFPVKKGDKLAGTRIIPLVIEEEKMLRAKEAAMAATGGKPILSLKPFVHKKIGIVTTGNEVFYGRIQDTFTPVLLEKFGEYDTEVIDHETWNDDDTRVTAAILKMIDEGIAEAYLRRMRECIFAEGRSLATIDDQVELASEFPIDVAQFRDNIESDAAVPVLQEGVDECRLHGVMAFPTLLLQYGENRISIHGYHSFEELKEAITFVTGGNITLSDAEYSIGALETYVDRFGKVAAREIQTMFSLDDMQLANAMMDLVSTGRYKTLSCGTSYFAVPCNMDR